MRHVVLIALLPLLVASRPTFGQQPPPDLDAAALRFMTGSRRAGSILFYYEEKGIPPELLEQTVKAARTAFEDLGNWLDLEPEGTTQVFLYRDEADLRARCGIPRGTPAAISPAGGIHQKPGAPCVEAFARILARRIPKGEDAVPPDRFFEEGFVGMCMARAAGTPLSIHAAVWLRAGVLPPLLPLRRAWSPPDDPHRGPAPHMVAGAFLTWLTEKYGVKKLKALYANCLECGQILGRSFALLEKDWHAVLRALPVEPDTEAKVRADLGLPLAPSMPAWIEGGRRQPLFDGKTLSGWTPEPAGSWKVEGGLLVGELRDGAAALFTAETFECPVAIRTEIRLADGNAVRLLSNRTGGGMNAAILARWNTFLQLTNGTFEASETWRIPLGEWIDAVLVNSNGTVSLYVNGNVVLASDHDILTTPGAVGLGVNKGRCEVRSVEVIRP